MFHFRFDMPLYLMALYGSIMIFAVCLLRAFLKNKLPKFVFPVLWGVVLLRFLVPFSISSPISAPVPDFQLESIYDGALVESAVTADSAFTQDFQASSIEAVAGNFQPNLPGILLVLWAVGTVVTVGILLYQKIGYSKRLKNSLLLEHNETVNRILRSMNMGHVLVFTNDSVASPLVAGLFRPKIYLPSGMDFENASLLAHILTHEAMHIRKKDNWVKAVMLVVICLNWYNPLVWVLSKFLSSDLEAACDAAVLKHSDGDEKQNYAYSLLAMAVSGSRPTLLYSAFSKTEVERRIKGILNYKKATALMLTLSLLFLFCGTVVFATGGQAPFSQYLSSYCASAESKWGAKASLTRDIYLETNAEERANITLHKILAADKDKAPGDIQTNISAALAKEFGVEKSAFKVEVSLCLSDEDLKNEYVKRGITMDANSNNVAAYCGEKVRYYRDAMIGHYQSRAEGTVDISIERDEMGNITSVTALHQGDEIFDERTLRQKSSAEDSVYAGTYSKTVVTER